MDTETGTESTQATPEAQAPVIATPEGAQPGNDTTIPNPAPEPPGSEPQVPYHRFAEVNRKMREYERQIASLQTPQPAPTQAQPQGAPKQEDFPTFEEYYRADVAYHGRTAAQEEFKNLQKQHQQGLQQHQEQDRQAKAYTNWSTQMQAAAAIDPTVKNLSPDVFSHWPTEFSVMMMAAENGGDLSIHLMKNPNEVLRIAGMDPNWASMELGKMSAKLAGSSGQPPRKPSAQVPNLDPVGQGKGPGNKNPNDYTQDDVIKRLYPH